MTETDLEKRALEGDVEAQCSLGFLYEIGLDRNLDFERAASFWLMAAKQGKQIAIDKLKQLISEDKIKSTWMDELSALPVPNEPESHPKAQQNQGVELSPKILLAEDEDDLRDLITEVLQSAGYRVVEAADGEEAARRVLGNPDIALIITDLKMPKMNGLQFLKTIKKLQIDKPTVIMTAYSQQKVIDEGLKLGIQSWIVKPVRKEMLLETVRKILGTKEKEASVA